MLSPIRLISLAKALVFASVALATSGTALADPPRASKYHWRNTAYPSHYILYDFASRTYIETIDCRVFYRFTLVENGVNTLTLYDQSRDMTVRLDYEHMYLKPSGSAGFTLYQNGTFDSRIQFSHNDAQGNYTGSISKKAACVWEEWFPGGRSPSFTFVQSSVNNDAVEVYDRSRDMTVRMDAGRMWLRQGNAPFGFFKDGHW